MKNLSFLLLLLTISWSTYSKDMPQCSESSKESGDVDLYWRIEKGEENQSPIQDICKISILSLKPTQFAVGHYSVKLKSNNLKDMSDKKLENYLQANPEPIVIGPHGEFFIIDHHHLARALYNIKVENTYGIILANWNNLNEEKFWNFMKEKNWIYLINENGERKTIDDLMKVKSVADLKDDPYRSLAGETRCKTESKCSAGEWLKRPIPFIEFQWAAHFRKTPSIVKALKEFGDDSFKKVIEAASDEVKRLKGVLPENESTFEN